MKKFLKYYSQKSFQIILKCKSKMSKRINYIIEEIADQYSIEDNNRPWIIGFSGGKDSTVLLTLTLFALLKIKN